MFCIFVVPNEAAGLETRLNDVNKFLKQPSTGVRVFGYTSPNRFSRPPHRRRGFFILPMSKLKHTFTGVFIPANIWLSKELSPAEKMILGEVDALSKDTGWCYAGRKHFSEWLNCTPSNVTYYISRLEEMGFLTVERRAGERSRMQIINERFYETGSKPSLPGSKEDLRVGSKPSLPGSKEGLLPTYIKEKNKIKREKKEKAEKPLSPPFKKVDELYHETLEENKTEPNPSPGRGAIRASIFDPSLPGVEIHDMIEPATKPPKNGRTSKTQDELDLSGRVIAYLNEKAGRNFRLNTGDNAKGIISHYRQGFTEAQMQKVIDLKIKQWGNDANMRGNINPVTLFRPANFERYLVEAELPPMQQTQTATKFTGQNRSGINHAGGDAGKYEEKQRF